MTRSATDSDGRCKIEFPRSLAQGDLYHGSQGRLRQPGRTRPCSSPERPQSPADHTIEMESGVTIGGIVKARDGKAIAGATVIIMARAGADNSPDWTYVPNVKVTTDAAGALAVCRDAHGLEFRVYFRVTHPDYVPTFMQRDVPTPSDLLLKAKKAEWILEEGLALAGTVVDDQGRPIAGATGRAGSGPTDQAQRLSDHAARTPRAASGSVTCPPAR